MGCSDQGPYQTYQTHIPALDGGELQMDEVVETKAGTPSPFHATKHQAVLRKGPDVDLSGKRVIFTVEPDDETDVPSILYVPRTLWEDMNQPDVVTITVQPGDFLNVPEAVRQSPHEGTDPDDEKHPSEMRVDETSFIGARPADRPPDPPYIPGNRVG